MKLLSASNVIKLFLLLFCFVILLKKYYFINFDDDTIDIRSGNNKLNRQNYLDHRQCLRNVMRAFFTVIYVSYHISIDIYRKSHRIMVESNRFRIVMQSKTLDEFDV